MKSVDNKKFIIFDDTCTYTVPLLKAGLDSDLDLEDVVSGATIIQNGGFVTISKDGYTPKCFIDVNFEWMLYIGYIKKDFN